MAHPPRRQMYGFPGLILLLLWLFTAPSLCFPGGLEPRATTVPAPVSVAPAQNFEGIDGDWNTYTLRIGTPEQVVRVHISTASQQVWTIAPQGCEASDVVGKKAIEDCANSRGGLFFANRTSTYEAKGTFSLWIEQNLGLRGNANYGFDTIGLGFAGEGGPILKNASVGALAVRDFYMGHLGLHPKPTNWSSFLDTSPSYMTTLKEQKIIPSLSYGYTAGAKYRFAVGILSSLTLGGYDASRFKPSGVSWNFAPDNERELVVNIQKIKSTDGSGKELDMLPSPIYSFIDSTVPQIWLPVEACKIFEQTFNLIYDNVTDLYFVNEKTHDALVARNPNVTFTLGTDPTSGNTVDIVLPYASFDLTAKKPYQGLLNDTRYFPIRRALNYTQFTLGRTFLQEAYLVVDHERTNFSVSPVIWEQHPQKKLVPIQSIDFTGPNPHDPGTSQTQPSALSTGAIVGIAVGGASVAALISLIILLMRRRKAKKSGQQRLESPDEDSPDRPKTEENTEDLVYPKAELDGSSPVGPDGGPDGYYKPGHGPLNGRSGPTIHIPSPNSPDGSTMVNPGIYSAGLHSGENTLVVSEADSKEREVFEMPGDMPVRQEADGRQMSEKEAMRVREERYNGVDPIPPAPSPTANSPTTPVSDSGRQRRQVNPGDVVAVPRPQVPTPGEHLEAQDRNIGAIVSPIDGPGEGFGTFSPMSPIAVSPDSPQGSTVDERARRRFSYE